MHWSLKFSEPPTSCLFPGLHIAIQIIGILSYRGGWINHGIRISLWRNMKLYFSGSLFIQSWEKKKLTFASFVRRFLSCSMGEES